MLESFVYTIGAQRGNRKRNKTRNNMKNKMWYWFWFISIRLTSDNITCKSC